MRALALIIPLMLPPLSATAAEIEDLAWLRGTGGSNSRTARRSPKPGWRRTAG